MFVKCQCAKCQRERSEILADRIQRMFDDDIEPPPFENVKRYRLTEIPPVSLGQGEYKTDIRPTLRRIDWMEVALWIFAGGILFVAAFLIGYARAKGSGV
jgi:hypothetical protein